MKLLKKKTKRKKATTRISKAAAASRRALGSCSNRNLRRRSMGPQMTKLPPLLLPPLVPCTFAISGGCWPFPLRSHTPAAQSTERSTKLHARCSSLTVGTGHGKLLPERGCHARLITSTIYGSCRRVLVSSGWLHMMFTKRTVFLPEFHERISAILINVTAAY